jgi:hypothetical protein
MRWLIALVLTFGAVNAHAAIRLPANAPDQVRWAASELDRALAEHKLTAPDVDVRVTIGTAAEPDDQAFALDRAGATVTIAGGGPAGAEYGLLELAEQIHGASGNDWRTIATALRPIKQKPWVMIRADNAFIQIHPFMLNDLDMWRAYIDMLARNRFNLLDLHGAYDLDTTQFPNLYPMLVKVPGYPKVGDPAAQAKNLVSLKAIVAYAASRGVRVALMNYSIAEDRPRIPGQKGVPPIAGVPSDKIADYTAKATAEIIRALPQLYMLGFRVGETGQPADFFKIAYLRGFALSGRKDLRLYTRSWLTSKEQLEPIAAAAPGMFDVEIKYNGEHLGLPYQAMQERFATYSYEHYLDTPAKYGVLWQVRSNGTHRFWSWANTNFIRQTVRTFRLGNARGFTLESPVSYFSPYASKMYRSAADQAVFPYVWQKDWSWYFAWGRLGYDPDLPEATVLQAWRDHYGAGGDAAYRAMQSASEVVPLVYAYRFIGADQRDFSPETETGYTTNDSVVGSRTPIPLSLMQYAQDQTEDDRSFLPIDKFVLSKMDGLVDGRYGPFAIAARLRDASAGADKAMAAMPALDGRAADEWRLLRTDLTAAARLGEYHADRIEALVWLDHGVRTKERTEVDRAIGLLKSSRDAWAALAATTDPVYQPLNNSLRRQKDFSWGPALASLEKLDATAEQYWADRPKGAHKNPLILSDTDKGGLGGLGVAEQPAYRIATDGGSVAVTAKASAARPIDRVVLWWKPLPSEAHWRAQEMIRSGDGYRAEVPFTREGLMYAVEVQDVAGNARSFPPQAETRPFWVIDPR